jgi:hypothetical protein
MLEKNTDGTVPSGKKTAVTKIQITEKFVLTTLDNSGYDEPYPAIYELLDNSIDAGATKIDINYDPVTKVLTIADNGCGMSFDTFVDCMNFGSDRTYGSNQTGVYGIGMKAGIRNLMDVELDTVGKILSYDGQEKTQMTWDILNSPMEFQWETELCNEEKTGTIIKVEGCVSINPAVLKKNLGVIYFPTLRNGVVTINVDDNAVIAYDPLYRDSNLTKLNYVDGKVCDDVVPTLCAYIDNTQEKHSWEGKNWSYSKCGVYAIYGCRYIEYGGNSFVKNFDPWDSRTRIEFVIPKSHTTTFNVRNNKTNNMSLRGSKLEHMRKSIIDQFNWASRNRKSNEPSTVKEDILAETEQIMKNLNKAASAINMFAPKQKVVVPSFTANPDKEPKEKTKPSTTLKIKERKPYEVRYVSLDSSAVFWHLHIENNTFIISLNENHTFYRKVFYTQSLEGKQALLSLLIPMAYIQHQMCDTPYGDVSDFWDNYWSNVSLKLQSLYNYL